MKILNLSEIKIEDSYNLFNKVFKNEITEKKNENSNIFNKPILKKSKSKYKIYKKN